VGEYSIAFTGSARRDLNALPLVAASRIRIGDYRVVYAVYDGERLVDIRIIRHRADAYR